MKTASDHKNMNEWASLFMLPLSLDLVLSAGTSATSRQKVKTSCCCSRFRVELRMFCSLLYFTGNWALKWRGLTSYPVMLHSQPYLEPMEELKITEELTVSVLG